MQLAWFILGKIRVNLTSFCLLELLAAEYLRETNISIYALKESSKEKETRRKKEIVEVLLQQASYCKRGEEIKRLE